MTSTASKMHFKSIHTIIPNYLEKNVFEILPQVHSANVFKYKNAYYSKVFVLSVS